MGLLYYGAIGRIEMIVKMESYFDGEMWCARGLGVEIFTQGASYDELIENVREAVDVHFDVADNVSEVLLLSEIKINHGPIAVG